MARFHVIPVIDLRGGQVVRARAGQRDAYAPIETPLASGSAPAEVARGLIAAFPSDILYVADLDAIMAGRDPDETSLAAIRLACPDAALWVDAGFADATSVARFLRTGLGRPVLGSESQVDPDLVRGVGEQAVLSLDTRGGERLGPDILHKAAADWPSDVIVMNLASIGVHRGPDLEAVAAARAKRPDARVYAAGGVRGPDDVTALERIGASGVLVASAIHDGLLRPRH